MQPRPCPAAPTCLAAPPDASGPAPLSPAVALTALAARLDATIEAHEASAGLARRPHLKVLLTFLAREYRTERDLLGRILASGGPRATAALRSGGDVDTAAPQLRDTEVTNDADHGLLARAAAQEVALAQHCAPLARHGRAPTSALAVVFAHYEALARRHLLPLALLSDGLGSMDANSAEPTSQPRPADCGQ